MKSTPVKIAATLVAAAIVLVACGPPEGPAQSALTPEELIARSKTAMSEVRSYRAEINTVITEGDEVTTSGGTMEFAGPDRFRTTSMDPAGTSETIQIASKFYHRDSKSDEWRVIASDRPLMASQRLEMGIFYGPLVGVMVLADEEIDGVLCYRFQGEVDMKAAAEEQRRNLEKGLDPSDPAYAAMLESQDEMTKALEAMTFKTEYWIGKDDFLPRRVGVVQETTIAKDPGGIETKVKYAMAGTFRFFDFNTDIIIEPPPNVEGVNLTANSISNAGGSDDIERQVATYEITITNQGTETARDVKVFVDSSATNDGLQTFEGVPADGLVTLGPGESAKYSVSWEFNLALMGKPRFLDLARMDVIRATWTDDDGQQKEKVLTKGGLPSESW